MIKEISYLKIGFDWYTEESEEIILGMFTRMGCDINPLDKPRWYIVTTEDDKIMEYLRFLVDCDMILMEG